MTQLENITAWIQANILFFLAAFALCILLLFIFCVVLLLKIKREKKRYDFFMGTARRPSYNLETQMKEYFAQVKAIDEKYTKLLDMVTDLDKATKGNICKVGLVRYNPFQEMGGNLCFALALLDDNDNGVVLNGIHSRTGSFTYAKPIEMGVSTYLLSEEEQEAIQRARDTAYEPQHEKVRKLKFKPLFKRRYAPDKSEANLPIRKEPLGDATQAEREQIQRENIQADKIAAGVFPMDTFFARFQKSEQQAEETAEQIAAAHPRRAEEAAMELRAAALQEEQIEDTTLDSENSDTEQDTDTSVTEQDNDTPVTEQDNDTSVTEQDNDTPVAEQDNDTPVAEQDNDTFVAEQDTNTSVTEQDTDTAANLDTECCDTELPEAMTAKIDTDPDSAYASLIFDAVERATEKLMIDAQTSKQKDTKNDT